MVKISLSIIIAICKFNILTIFNLNFVFVANNIKSL